ncbi:MAG: class I adenylate-forming enzyme family protein, partial [Burkholderiaceae bacterium]
MLRRSAERFPHKTAIIRDDQQMTYAQLDCASNRLARALLALGLPKGAKVAIISRNLPEYATAFFGVARSGLVLVNVSILYAPDELAWVLQKADIAVVLFDALLSDKVLQVLPQCPAITQRVRIDSPESRAAAGARAWPADGHTWVAFNDFQAGHADDDPAVPLHEDDPFCMTYT